MRKVNQSSREELLRIFFDLPTQIIRKVLHKEIRTCNIPEAKYWNALFEDCISIRDDLDGGALEKVAHGNKRSICRLSDGLLNSIFQWLDCGTVWFSAVLVSRKFRKIAFDPNSWKTVSFPRVMFPSKVWPTHDFVVPPGLTVAFLQRWSSAWSMVENFGQHFLNSSV